MLDLKKIAAAHNNDKNKSYRFMVKSDVEELGILQYIDPEYYDLGIEILSKDITIFDIEDIFRSYDQAIVIVDNKIRTGESAPNRYIEVYIQNGKIIPDLIRAAC